MGNSTYLWSKHKRTNFDWWRKRFKRQFELVDLRVDHFRGLAGYWRVNGKNKTAISGKWINSQGENINKIKKDLELITYQLLQKILG